MVFFLRIFSSFNQYFLGLLLLVGVIGFIILLLESFVLVILRNLILIFCLFFFSTHNLLFLFICLEVVTFLILLTLLFYGYQIEKVSSSWFLLILGISTRMMLLYLILVGVAPGLILVDIWMSKIFLIFLFLRFFIKLPIFILHVWLPKVHVESPTIGRVLLASLLLKLGGWGIIIFMTLIFPLRNYTRLILFLSVVFCGTYCIYQRDGKALVGYSSVFHITGFLLFLITNTLEGEFSSYLIMVAHGFVSSILFLYVGYIYRSVLSREVIFHQGIIKRFLLLGVVVLTYFLLNRGLPPTIGFISEVYGLISLFIINISLLFLLIVYFILGFYYSLRYGLSIFMGAQDLSIFFNSVLLLFFLFLLYGLLLIF